MNRFTLSWAIASVVISSGCSTDVIDHSGDNNKINGNETRDAGAIDAAAPDAGPSCQLTWDPGFVDFGASAIGSANTLAVIAQNTTAVPCIVSSIAITPATSPFTVVAQNGLPETVAPGALFDPGVTFTPTAVGPADAVLRIVHSGGTDDIPLHGAGSPAEIASNASAEFLVQNVSSQELFLVTYGWFCDAFDVQLPLQIAYPPVCEGPPPMPPTATIYRRILPGESYSLSWDGREFVYITYDFDCTERGNMDFIISVPAGARQPVTPLPAALEVRIAYETTLPTNCRDEGDFVYCEPEMFGGGGGNFTLVAEICPAARMSSAVPFTLTEGANVQVTIPIAP